jgi:hypothetical protein
MPRHGSRVTTPLARSLVGRRIELELLDRILDEACQGSPLLVVVSGESAGRLVETLDTPSAAPVGSKAMHPV